MVHYKKKINQHAQIQLYTKSLKVHNHYLEDWFESHFNLIYLSFHIYKVDIQECYKHKFKVKYFKMLKY